LELGHSGVEIRTQAHVIVFSVVDICVLDPGCAGAPQRLGFFFADTRKGKLGQRLARQRGFDFVEDRFRHLLGSSLSMIWRPTTK
jgi:hypothetical protein